MSVSLRPATSADVAYLVDLLGSEDVAPFLAAVRASTAEAVAEEVARSEREPEAFGVLAGGHPDGGWWGVAGTLAVVLSSLAYASGNVIGQRSVSGTPGPVLATGAMATATLTLLPFALLQAPTSMPDTDAILSLLALALLGTALAQLVLYRMLNRFGARSVSLVTYLMPGFALVYGALLLDEAITPAALAGLGLILAGVALGSGGLRRATAATAEAAAR